MRVRNLIHRAVGGATDARLKLLSRSAAQRRADACLRMRHKLMTRVRQHRALELGDRGLEHVRTAQGTPLTRSIDDHRPAWIALTPNPCPIPGMLTAEDQQYYGHITQFYSGQGAVVELGTWLGMSTFHLIHGLTQNPHFKGPLYCFDDYIWRDSMTKWVKGSDMLPPHAGESFESIFQQMLDQAGVADQVAARRSTFVAADASTDVPAFAWDGGAIELCIVDCGRTLAVNNGWWHVLRPHFVPGRTLIVMQDWQTFKAVPYQFWNQTKIFTDDKLKDLDLIHELHAGGVGTFLFQGPGGEWAAEFHV